MTTDTESTPPHGSCARCGRHLRGTGTKSKVVGKRYCMKRECQAAKQRAYRAMNRHGELEAPMDERPCFLCGVELLRRPVRITDSPIGRWCRAAACQRDRALRQKIGALIDAGDNSTELFLAVAKAYRDMHEKRRVPECPECGLLQAVPGYPHPDREGNKCTALGTFPVTPSDLPFAWENGPQYAQRNEDS